MEDSSLFMLWALSTLQHEDPPATPAPASDAGGGHNFSSHSEPVYSASLDCMAPGEPLAREGHRVTGSWSSGDTDSGGASVTAALERDGWSSLSQSSAIYAAPRSGGAKQPVSWNFSSKSARPSKEAINRNCAATARATDDGGGAPLMVQESPPPRKTNGKSSGSPSSAPYVQHHILAERKRREKINQRFIELSTVIPGLKKMDKATILSDATIYVKKLKEKLKAHEDGGSNGHRNRNIESAVLAKKPRITAPDDEDSPSSAATSGALQEIEARISEGNVMVRIHCEDFKGSLVVLLAEVEKLHLSIVYANAMPFSASTQIISIMAQVEEGFDNTTADDIVTQLCCALNQHSTNKKQRMTRSSC